MIRVPRMTIGNRQSAALRAAASRFSRGIGLTGEPRAASRLCGTQCGFTLMEILVAVAVMAILGLALIGLMSAAVTAWRRGEADRQLHEKLQALQRQIADDLAAAVVDPPPVPDFHYALDTLWDLPADNDPYYIISSGAGFLKSDAGLGPDARYFAPDGANGAAEVVLRIRVPFPIGAALLKARCDSLDANASIQLQVARNAAGTDTPGSYQTIETLSGEGMGGAERDITDYVRDGDMVFIRATMRNGPTADSAQFLRGDRLRSEGRPVLILDCYKNPNTLPQRPRPTFQAYYENGAQVVSWVRTIPGENEKATLRQQALGGRARVVYRFRPYPPEANKPGLGVLRRGYQVPLDDSVAVRDIPTQDFITSVLHFSMSFWGADTTVWETRPELESDYGTKYSSSDPPHPPSRRWLSSRYIPEQVQVTVVLEPDRARHLSVGLRTAIDDDDTGTLQLSSAKGFPSSDHAQDFVHDFIRDPRHFVKIDNEWLYYERVDFGRSVLIIPSTGRGVRGTAAVAHASGADVWRGRAFVFTVAVPAFRHWQR